MIQIVFLPLFLFFSFSNAGPLAADDLRIEYLSSPVVGVDVPQPRFSWILHHTARSINQTAYQILVSTDPSVSSGSVWDSGKVSSHNNSQIIYGGSPLRTDTSYYWKIRWWDSFTDAAPYSNVSRFDTGIFKQSEWIGSWIGGYNMLRKEFTIGSFQRARIFICGLGYYELFINGRKVGDHKLDPGWTEYSKRDLYVVYDVGEHLKQGINAIGVMLGGGWWSQGVGGAKMVNLLLSLDGQFSITTNSSWKGIQGPITMDSVYNGETYDARLEQPGWSQPNFNESSWSPAKIVSGPGGILSSQLFPPIRILETLKPLAITMPSSGVYIFDFGQNFSGWVKLTVRGPMGTTVTLRHAEILKSDGNIYTDNLRSAKATDTYILKGNHDGEFYEPRFTYHGFRFVEVTGFPGTPTLSTLEGIHVASSLRQRDSFFKTNVEVLNRIQHNILWGQASNFMSVPTDCDQRDERLGWMGDGQLSSAEAHFNFDVAAFYSNWAQLIEDDEINGQIADVVPFMRFGNRPGDPAWSAAFPEIVYGLWKRQGDRTIITKHYTGLVQYTEFLLQSVNKSGLGQIFAFYGDWVPPPPVPKASIQLTAAFYFLLNLKQISEMAMAIGNTVDSQKYSQLYNSFVPQFNQAFYHSQNHLYDNGVQTALLMPLYLQIVPSSDQVNVTANLLNDIVTLHDTHLTTGILGTKYLPIVLTESGNSYIALQLALQTTYPSWGYMIYQTQEVSATTLWELWDSPSEGPGMNSRNHIMFGSIGEWFYTGLAGIDQLKGSVAFKHISIRLPPAEVILQSPLMEVNASTVVPTGLISVYWQRVGGTICGEAPENSNLTLSCGQNGGTISSISFASFGTANGTCGFYSMGKCNAANSNSIISNQCLGKSSCTINSSDQTFGDPCYGTLKHLIVQAKCSVPIIFYTQISIPVNSDAVIHLSKLSLSNVVVTESGTVIWKNNQFFPLSGITFGADTPQDIIFILGSGHYNFQLSGTPGTVICQKVAENSNLNLKCPGSTLISLISFASFGNSNSTCTSPSYGTCHVGSSKFIVDRYCLGKGSCVVPVTDGIFGDPCFGILKNLVVQAVCSS